MSDHGWNFANLWERVAARIPDSPAQSHGERWLTWAEFDRRANGVAALLLEQGVARQDKVAQLLYNCPEYLESIFACFKVGLVPVNTNYRYAADELVYVWDNADAVAVVFQGTFTERIEPLRARLPKVRTWLWVDDSSGPCPDWAAPYDAATATGTAVATTASWGRRGDDLLFLYTGGTTGMPKGVMWPQGALFAALDANNRKRLPPEQDLDAAGERVSGPGPRNLPGAPLMHGTGQFNAMSNLMVGGSVHTLVGRSFDPHELLSTIGAKQINSMSIVGDAFAKPILRALDEAPERYDISSLRVVVSSGVMFAADTKAGLLRHNKRLILVDALGSSEAIGMATSTTTLGDSSQPDSTATFVLGPNTRVLNEDGLDVVPGSGELGRVAMRGFTPVGYWKDEAKSAATFITIDGERYSMPGDWATVEADRTVKLLGRGSQCINTGGEKVYPEEVEEALKLHPSVLDAAVVGLPDERFGEMVCALVELAPGATLDLDALSAHARSSLAAFKSPRRIWPVATIGRAANGKLDYRSLKATAVALMG